tara:strand:+ start:2168 stop:3079 length:912 start_codon:yes stop_codon:yes gene_type:complete
MSINLLNIYIKTLVDNVNIENIPKYLDIVFDGGAFNGGMGFGTALYLKELEKRKITKISRVSGCSIGSIIALSFLLDFKYDINKIFISVCKNFKNTFNLSVFKDHIKKIIYDNLTDDLSFLNNKLYITYYDAVNYKHIMICNYKNRDHLIDCLMRSCHIPYITMPTMMYDEKYIDGVTPYIFRDGLNNVLFVNMITIKNYKYIFNVGKENNVNHRMMIGINDINKFFVNKKSDMCSYYNGWSWISVFMLRMRIMIVFIILWIVNNSKKIKHIIPPYFLENSVVKNINMLLKELYNDLMYKIIN